MREIDRLALAWAREPFVWGESDCCQRVLGVLAGRAGRIDLIARYQRAYRSPRGALRLMTREGGMEALFDRLAEALGGVRLTGISAARVMDVAIVHAGAGVRVSGFVAGAGRVLVPAVGGGIAYAPLAAGACVWRVPAHG